MLSPVRFISSTETTRAGLSPSCSCPSTGLSVTNQMSPCLGVSLLIPQPILQRRVELAALVFQSGERLGVAFFQLGVEAFIFPQEQPAFCFFQFLLDSEGLPLVPEASQQAAQNNPAGFAIHPPNALGHRLWLRASVRS